MAQDLERLYQYAKSALKTKNYDRASNLLRQILTIDENYKDASRLLAQMVKLRRRRWYSHPLLWGAWGLVMLIALGIFITPRLQGLYASQPSATVATTNNPTATLTPTFIATATETSLPAPTAVPLTWKRVWLGQEFPRDTVTAFAISPKDPDVLYAGMKNSGIYKSIDGGISWRPAHSGLADITVESLVIDFQDTQILYAGTPSGIFKSEDGGEKWSRIGEGNYLLVDPQDNSHLYGRDGDNILESTDQGKTWEVVYSSKAGCPGKILSWAIHPADGKTLFLGGGDECERGIYQSNDGGHTWILIKKVENPPGFEMAPWLEYLVVPMDWLAVRLDEGNVIVDYGPAWETPDSAGLVYADCDPFLCRYSPDREDSVRLGKPNVGVLTTIAISPHDPNTIYVAGEGIAATNNGGQTWSKRSNGLGGMQMTLETGEGEPPTLYLQQVEECLEYDPVIGKEPGQPLYISNDGGLTWKFSTAMGCYLIKDTREPTLYRRGMAFRWDSEGNSATWIWRSQDGGKSWTKVFTPENKSIPTAQGGLIYLNRPDVYEGVPYHWEWISEDYGQNWRVIDPPKDAKLCYGSTLQFIDEYRPMAIDPNDGNHVFVIDNGTLLESHNSCDTTQTFATTPNASMNSIAFDPNKPDTIYAGTDSGAYVSFDVGQTWGQINDGLLGATVVYSIVVDNDSNVYAATPYGIFKLESK